MNVIYSGTNHTEQYKLFSLRLKKDSGGFVKKTKKTHHFVYHLLHFACQFFLHFLLRSVSQLPKS